MKVVNLQCELDPEDKLFALKLELMETTETKFRYLLKDNFENDDSFGIISFLRFVVYDED
jgi:hypothetical protein